MLRRDGDEILDGKRSSAKGHHVGLGVDEAILGLQVVGVLLRLAADTVLHVVQDGARGELLGDGDGIFQAEVGGPEAVQLELHIRAEFGEDVVVVTSVSGLAEFPIVIVHEEFEAVAVEDLPHLVGDLGGALDGVHVLKVVGTIASDNALETELVGGAHALSQAVQGGPWSMAGDHLQSQVIQNLEEFSGVEVEDAGGFDVGVANLRNALQDAQEILLGVFTEGVQLDANRFCHVL